jgi:UPF0755 protein
MGYLRAYLKTRQGRRVGVSIAAALSVWLLVRCGSNSSLPSLIYLPEADPSRQLEALQAQGLAIADDDLRSPLRPGWVRLGRRRTLQGEELIAHLRSAPREKTRRVVMYSGDTIHLFAQRLSSQTNLSEDKLLNAYHSYSPYSDGGILAGYYHVPYKTTLEATMFYLVYRSEQAFREITARHHIPYRYTTFKNYLTVASIIQKETWHSDEMPHIASVIYNRLQKGQKLQLDATLNYGPYAHTPVIPERIRNDASRFNTYRYPGLPPEPIGSVSRAALDAAMMPAQTHDFYFVRTPKGWHDFSSTYTRHLEKIQRYKTLKSTTKVKNSNF